MFVCMGASFLKLRGKYWAHRQQLVQPMREPWNPWSREGQQSKHALSRLFILCWGKGFFFHFRHAMSVLLSHDSRTCEQ